MPTVSVNLDHKNHAQLKALASREGVSTSEILRTVLLPLLNGPASPFDSGWRAGRAAAYAVTLCRFREVVVGLEPTERRTGRTALAQALAGVDDAIRRDGE